MPSSSVLYLSNNEVLSSLPPHRSLFSAAAIRSMTTKVLQERKIEVWRIAPVVPMPMLHLPSLILPPVLRGRCLKLHAPARHKDASGVRVVGLVVVVLL